MAKKEVSSKNRPKYKAVPSKDFANNRSWNVIEIGRKNDFGEQYVYSPHLTEEEAFDLARRLNCSNGCHYNPKMPEAFKEAGMKEGDIVMIYEDPITKQNPEGIARLRENQKHNNIWTVEFIGHEEEGVFYRKIFP